MVIPDLDAVLGAGTRLRPAARSALQKAELNTAAAILLHLPQRYLDRRHAHPFASCRQHPVNTVAAVTAHHYRRLRRSRQLVIDLQDDSAAAELVCYGRESIKYLLPVGAQVRVSGNFALQYGRIQATQFEFEPCALPELSPAQRRRYSRFNKLVPVYRLPTGISQQDYFRVMLSVLDRAIPHRRVCDCADAAVRRYVGAPVSRALMAVHVPPSVAAAVRARTLLARHELLALQIRMQPRPPAVGAHASAPAVAPDARSAASAALALDGVLAHYPLALPFDLTTGQRHALQAIYGDLHAERSMKRLLQGDVGVGKTLVALLATIPILRSGGQVAFMVPNELLVYQQSRSARSLFGATDVAVITLGGSLTARERSAQKEAIATGASQLIIGTHVLFSSDIVFANLRLTIVDEQHRFGVRQRVALTQKGQAVHQLYMTATPIPRTLALARYNGFDITVISERPPGRRTVRTNIVAERNEQRVYNAVMAELQCGHQAYFVYPLIEEGGTDRPVDDVGALFAQDSRSPPTAATAPILPPVRSAEQMAAYLSRAVFPTYTVACIHSRLPEDERQSIMARFIAGDVQVLVATSVIEVGVDVPNATCMVIHHAERFGLASLHQLRGRVGRAQWQSYAFLIYGDARPLNDDAKSRLKVMYQQSDGFIIAEADLLIRGPGELTGTKQSGTTALMVAHFPAHLDFLLPARRAAAQVWALYPDGVFPACIGDIQALFARPQSSGAA